MTARHDGDMTETRRVVVTGGSGKLGRAVVAHLSEQGWDVVNLDRVPPAVPQPAFVRVDLTDHGEVASALSGVDDRYSSIDAVVHLAAIPAPGLASNAATLGKRSGASRATPNSAVSGTRTAMPPYLLPSMLP